MGTAITTAQEKSLAAPTSKPRLSEKLKGLLEGNETPVIGPNTARELQAWVEQAEASRPAQATEQEIDRAVSMLSLALKERAGTTAADARARLQLFVQALRGVSGSDLERGSDKMLKTTTFMPSPAELRNAALSFAARREYAISRARHLLWKHEVEYVTPPADLVPPDELAALLSSAAETLKDETNGNS